MIVDNIFFYIYDKRFVYQVIATLSTYLGIRFLQFFRYRQRLYKLFEHYGIPGPKQSLLGGNLDQYRGNEGNNFYKLDVEFRKKYGKVYGIFLGDEPSVIISDLDMLKAIFIEDKEKTMTERSAIFIESPIVHSVLFAKYARWKAMRRILSPHFSKYTTRGQTSTEFIEDSIRLLLNYIEDKLKKSSDVITNQKIELDIFDLMKSTTLHLISTMAVRLPDVQIKNGDENVKSLDEYLSSCDKGIVIWAIKFPILKPVLQVLADNFGTNNLMGMVRRSLRKTLYDGLQRLAHGRELEKQQVIDIMIKLHKDGSMTELEVLGNAEALLIAGYDTTATTLSYLFWILAKNPDVQDKLRSELISHGTESEYLTQVINETMRLYPVVSSFTTRITDKTIEVNGWTIPQGTRIVYNAWLMNNDPELWPEPRKFDPERFANDANIHPCAFAPFGLGNRKCLGFQLATLELKMITCDMLLRYRLSLKSPEDLKLVNCASVLTKPSEKIIIELTRYNRNQ